MNVLIIEDEMLAAERLQLLIKDYDPSITMQACLDSIEDSVKWLQTKPHPDLLLIDIQLSDGPSFEIFKKVTIQKPVIFTTAYDNYALDAFQLFSIDYILKPITAESLATAFNKYKNLSAAFFASDYSLISEQLKENFSNKYRNRFLAKVGQRSFFIKSEEVACFIADNKIVNLLDKEGNRYLINYTLEKLEPLLDPHNFFRLNRKVIVHSNAIDQVKPYYNNRLKLVIKGIKQDNEIIVSRDRVVDFKIWADT
jgi:two-component system, LytTR family, response regulator LytT